MFQAFSGLAQIFDDGDYRTMILVNALVLVAFPPLLWSIAAHVNALHAIVTAGTLQGVGIAAAALTTDPLLSTLAWSAGEATLIAIIPAIVAGIAPHAAAGRYRAAFATVQGAAAAIATFGGPLIARASSEGFAATSLILTAAGVAAIIARRRFIAVGLKQPVACPCGALLRCIAHRRRLPVPGLRASRNTGPRRMTRPRGTPRARLRAALRQATQEPQAGSGGRVYTRSESGRHTHGRERPRQTRCSRNGADRRVLATSALSGGLAPRARGPRASGSREPRSSMPPDGTWDRSASSAAARAARCGSRSVRAGSCPGELPKQPRSLRRAGDAPQRHRDHPAGRDRRDQALRFKQMKLVHSQQFVTNHRPGQAATEPGRDRHRPPGLSPASNDRATTPLMTPQSTACSMIVQTSAAWNTDRRSYAGSAPGALQSPARAFGPRARPSPRHAPAHQARTPVRWVP